MTSETPPPAPPDGGAAEAAHLDYMHLLADREAAGEDEMLTLELGHFTAMTMISALQLATRHPGLTGPTRDVLRRIVDTLKPAFEGTPCEEIIRRGEHPEFDQ